MRALRDKPARPARHEPAVAAPVQEEHDLLPSLEPVCDKLPQVPRQDRPVARAQLLPEVADPHIRQRPAGQPLMQLVEPVLAALCAAVRLQGRRRRTQKHDRARRGRLRDVRRDFPRVVLRHRLVLVRPLVLLIDHNDPSSGKRCKQRRSGPDDHVKSAAPGPLVLVRPLGVREA